MSEQKTVSACLAYRACRSLIADSRYGFVAGAQFLHGILIGATIGSVWLKVVEQKRKRYMTLQDVDINRYFEFMRGGNMVMLRSVKAVSGRSVIGCAHSSSVAQARLDGFTNPAERDGCVSPRLSSTTALTLFKCIVRCRLRAACLLFLKCIAGALTARSASLTSEINLMVGDQCAALISTNQNAEQYRCIAV